MTGKGIRKFGFAALFMLMASFSFTSENGRPSDDFISIEVLSPAAGTNNQIPVEAASGWPLTFRLTANNELGIGYFPNQGASFPIEGKRSLLVFENPDGCLSWAGTNPPCPFDETSLEFTPGDGRLNPYEPLKDIIPYLYTFDVVNKDNSQLRLVGPTYQGYGPAGRLPGLVIVSDAGVGLVLDEHFNMPKSHPRKRVLLQARNLAGFLSSLDYELNDATSHTSLIGHMSVPNSDSYALNHGTDGGGLFTPLVMVDRSIGPATPAGPCPDSETWLVRVDGGGIAEIPRLTQLTGKTVTIRIFLVNGIAPWTLTDLDSNGIIGAKDAALAGYSLLSSEAVVRVNYLYLGSDFFGISYDLDGNGCAPDWTGAPCPGGLVRIPR